MSRTTEDPIENDTVETVAQTTGLAFNLVSFSSTSAVVNAAAAGTQNVTAGIAAILVSEKRSRIVAFSYPYFPSGLQIMTSVEIRADNFQFTRPFASTVWLLILASIVSVGLIVYVFERQFYKKFSFARGVLHAIWHSSTTLFNQSEEHPNTLSARVMALAWMAMSLILSATYTAILTASLTLSAQTALINSPDDLPGHTIGCVTGSFANDWAVASSRGAYLSLFPDLDSAINAMFAGTVEAVVHDSPLLHYWLLTHPTTGYNVVGPVFSKTDIAIVFEPSASNFNNTQLINKGIITYLETAAYSSSYAKYFGGTAVSTSSSASSSVNSATVSDIGVAFACILGGGAAIAIVIRIGKAIWRKFLRKRVLKQKSDPEKGGGEDDNSKPSDASCFASCCRGQNAKDEQQEEEEEEEEVISFKHPSMSGHHPSSNSHHSASTAAVNLQLSASVVRSRNTAGGITTFFSKLDNNTPLPRPGAASGSSSSSSLPSSFSNVPSLSSPSLDEFSNSPSSPAPLIPSALRVSQPASFPSSFPRLSRQPSLVQLQPSPVYQDQFEPASNRSSIEITVEAETPVLSASPPPALQPPQPQTPAQKQRFNLMQMVQNASAGLSLPPSFESNELSIVEIGGSSPPPSAPAAAPVASPRDSVSFVPPRPVQGPPRILSKSTTMAPPVRLQFSSSS